MYSTWDDNIKIDLKKVMAAQKPDSCASEWGKTRILVNTVLSHRAPTFLEFLDLLRKY
jgi:hypothetical protein